MSREGGTPGATAAVERTGAYIPRVRKRRPGERQADDVIRLCSGDRVFGTRI